MFKGIIGPPYEGALYWLFSSHRERFKHPSEYGHQYYQTLYGHRAPDLMSHTASIAAIFDEIVVATADATRPGLSPTETYSADLRLRFTEWPQSQPRDEIDFLAKAFQVDSAAVGYANRVKPPGVDLEFFIRDLILRFTFQATALDQTPDAILVCGEDYLELCAIMERLCKAALNISKTFAPQSQTLVPERSEIFMLLFGDRTGQMTPECFAEIRQDKDIQRYGQTICEVITAAEDEVERERAMANAIAETIEKRDAASRATKVLGTTSTALAIGGMIPGFGEILGSFSIMADLSAKASERKAHAANWYSLGARVRELEIRDYLNRKDNLLR